mmetsp:Transcript_7946/g.19388  ORF Transcript_7946/g.19388 Transcript_7946/m.19388 type:complete len:201 (+) Transcript_7946:43-645(+)
MLRHSVLLLTIASASAFAPGVLNARPSAMRLRMCQPVEEAVRGAPPPPPPTEPEAGQINPLTRMDKPWTERTTTLDREQRIGGDPLSPRREAASAQPKFPTPGASGQRIGNKSREISERDSYKWFKAQEEERSMFGVTMNPLTGNLEQKSDNAKVINPFVDPLFYVLVSVAAPFLLLVGGAYGCAVPALSMAFGAECPMY